MYNGKNRQKTAVKKIYTEQRFLKSVCFIVVIQNGIIVKT